MGQLLDVNQPIGLLHAGILHHALGESGPLHILAGYLDALASGSYRAISHFHDPRDGSEVADAAQRAEQVLLSDELGSGTFRSTAYLEQRRLDRTTKELIFIVSLTVMRASQGHIQSHIRVALDLGISPEEILEAIEISLPEAVVVAFQTGFDAWQETVDAEGLEPTGTVHEGETSNGS